MIFVSSFIFLFIAKCVLGDTPANCTYEDARGTWIFKIGVQAYKHCDFASNSKLVVNLMYPDIAKDQYGNTGFWTLIYNQGFEVVIGGRKYFGFFKYESNGSKVISYCDQLLPGRSHDVLVRHWTCFNAKKNTRIRPRLHLEPEIPEADLRMIPNRALIADINGKQTSWRATLYPEMSRWSRREVFLRSGGPRSRVLNRPRPAPISEELRLRASALPAEFDWRNVDGHNYVSPVRNQQTCGSCYSFSSMGMLESRLRILRNNTENVQLSEQDIVDCSPYSQGCKGGFPYLVAGKNSEDFGSVIESCNPYTGLQNTTCSTDTKSLKCQRRYYATNYQYVGGYFGACNEPLMRIALVRNGPISVSFEVYSDFFHYKSGIYQHSSIKDGFNPFQLTNHAVLIVGYGKDKDTGKLFWIVKNSWGTGWGENGYFRILRNADECGIESMAVESFPIL